MTCRVEEIISNVRCEKIQPDAMNTDVLRRMTALSDAIEYMDGVTKPITKTGGGVTYHTPGPWQYQYEDGRYVIVHDLEMGQAAIAFTGGWYPTNVHNARLIALSPEMLAVLKEISYHADNQDMSHLDFRVLMAEAARDVITRAEQS